MTCDRIWLLLMFALSLLGCGPAPPAPMGPAASVNAAVVDGRDLIALIGPMREYHGEVSAEVAEVAEAAAARATGEWDLPGRVAELQSLQDRCHAELAGIYGDRVSTDDHGDLVLGEMTIRPYFLQAGHLRTGGEPRSTAWGISTEPPFQLPSLTSDAPAVLPTAPDAPAAVPWVIFGWNEVDGVAWALTPSESSWGSGLQLDSTGLRLLRWDGPVAQRGPRPEDVLRVHELPGGERRWVLRNDLEGWVSGDQPTDR